MTTPKMVQNLIKQGYTVILYTDADEEFTLTVIDKNGNETHEDLPITKTDKQLYKAAGAKIKRS